MTQREHRAQYTAPSSGGGCYVTSAIKEYHSGLACQHIFNASTQKAEA